ncbi:centromere protein Q-like isoform X2 [Pseudophryne corroboree]
MNVRKKDLPGTKRKKQDSDDHAQTSHKKQRRDPSAGKSIRVAKTNFQKSLSTEVSEYIEICINTAIMSVLSNKKLTSFHAVQTQLSNLKARLLQHCKKIKVPVSKLGNVKSLRRELVEEQRKMEINQATLDSLTHEVEKAVKAANTVEESTEDLEAKLEWLKQRAEGADQSPDTVKHLDPIQLPKSTFKAQTMQEKVQKLRSSKILLGELSQIESSPVYKNMLTLIEKSYAEIDSL